MFDLMVTSVWNS